MEHCRLRVLSVSVFAKDPLRRSWLSNKNKNNDSMIASIWWAQPLDPDCGRRPPNRGCLFFSGIHDCHVQWPNNPAQESLRSLWTHQQEDQILTPQISLLKASNWLRGPRHDGKLRDSTHQTGRETDRAARDPKPNNALLGTVEPPPSPSQTV